MGRLIDGKWVSHDLGADERGYFIRRAAKFRGLITRDGSSGFAAQKGRYHLYVSYACGWSHRALIFRKLKGLEAVISVSYADPFMGEHGWVLRPSADPINSVQRLYTLYQRAQSDYTGRASVPVLWDRHTERIVSNESLDIIRSFDSAFDEFSSRSISFFPAELSRSIDEMIAINYERINNGVYRAGFARSQKAYDEAVSQLFERLDQLEALLSKRRYLLGDRMTAADFCLFPTLFRFDLVYYHHFKCNLRRLCDYENLWGYTRELFQLDGVSETCRTDQIKQHYCKSHESINPWRIVPVGPQIDYAAPHGRDGIGTRSSKLC